MQRPARGCWTTGAVLQCSSTLIEGFVALEEDLTAYVRLRACNELRSHATKESTCWTVLGLLRRHLCPSAAAGGGGRNARLPLACKVCGTFLAGAGTLVQVDRTKVGACEQQVPASSAIAIELRRVGPGEAKHMRAWCTCTEAALRSWGVHKDDYRALRTHRLAHRTDFWLGETQHSLTHQHRKPRMGRGCPEGCVPT